MTLALAALRGLSRRGLPGMRGPVYAMVQLTHSCNLRCRMCRVWTLGRPDEPPRLGVEEHRALARALARAGVRVVTLAGEPFLRRDLPELVALYAGEGMLVRLQTNGTLVDDRSLPPVLEAGLSGISISLHSLDAARMDALSGRPGTLRRVQRGFRAVARHAPRGFLAVANAVLFPWNLSELPRLVAAARDLGFRLSVIPLHRSGPREAGAQFASELPADLLLGPEHRPELERAVAFLLRERRRGGVLNSRRYLRLLPRFVYGEPAPWPCRAGELYVFVDHEGRVAPCHEREPAGSLLEPGVARALARGELFQPGREGCAGCLLPCWTELSLLYAHPGAFLEAIEVNLRT